MKPYVPLRNKIKDVRAKIEDEDEEREAVPLRNSVNNIDINIEIEEDIINRHSCMINLLRVVDYLNSTFPDPRPSWMGPISLYLQKETISLAQRILLIKLILNRPNIFNQRMMWAPHLLNYLSLDYTGSKYIHYFYRDALKRYIQMLPDFLQEETPDLEKLNKVIQKLVACLPHQNMNAYFDNVTMLQELLKVKGVFVERKTIEKMLKGDEKKEESVRNDWRMCAIIVIKICLALKVPIMYST